MTDDHAIPVDPERLVVSAIPIRVRRAEFEDGFDEGFVFAVGPTWVGLHRLDEGYQVAGMSFLMIDDVTDVETPSPRAELIARLMRRRAEQIPRPPPVDVSTIRSILKAAGHIAPLVCIHVERDDPEICFIGQVVFVDDDVLRLRCVDPDGAWDDDLDDFDLVDITRVDVGDRYLKALELAVDS